MDTSDTPQSHSNDVSSPVKTSNVLVLTPDLRVQRQHTQALALQLQEKILSILDEKISQQMNPVQQQVDDLVVQNMWRDSELQNVKSQFNKDDVVSSVLNKEALQPIVARIMIEEFKGALGNQIATNIGTLVRQEIQNALAEMRTSSKT